VTYKQGKPVTPTKKTKGKIVKSRKRSGYGTAMVSKITSGVKIEKFDGNSEIIWGKLELNGSTGAVVTAYRSPSMGKPSIENFYQNLGEVFTDLKKAKNLDFLIFVGDDNASVKSSSHNSRMAAKCFGQLADKHLMVDLIPGIATRGKNQPDTCFAYFDPNKVEICANLLAGVAATGSDHELIQIQVKKSGIIAEPLKFKKMWRLKKFASSKQISILLEKALEKWYLKWYPKINSHTSADDLRIATDTLVETLNQVKNSCYKKVLKNVHKNAKSNDSDTDLNILRLRALIAKFAWIIKKNPRDLETRKKLIDVNGKLEAAVRQAAKQKLEDDMRAQEHAERKNDSSFWDLTGSILNKSAYVTSINKDLTEGEINEKLGFYDETFINSDPDFAPNYESYKNIVPESEYKLNSEEEFIETIIERTHKIKPFFKDNRKIISKSISVIVQMMDIVKVFPESANTSNCHIIGKPPKERVIFALEAIPKILENIAKASLDDIKQEDGTFQMAYTTDRGCVSCNVLTLQYVEMCNEPTLHSQQDLKKAFNRACRETIINEAQRKFGAGKLFKSWFLNRTYKYTSKFGTIVRGLNHNQGVPAGTLLGVESFLLFIATCSELTGKNLKLLWAALYADDTSPLVKASNVVDFQKALDWAMIWAQKNGCAFHLEGDKGPVYLAYLKKNHVFPAEFDSIKLGSASLKRKEEETVLGLYRKVRPIDDNSSISHGKLIDKYGYECQWNVNKLKSIAYRLQRIKYKLVPLYTKKLVAAYFCGVLRFSASVIWLRSSLAHKNEVRYYYCMALAACLGLTTAEALNLSCCKNNAVTAENNYYQRLLDETGLPSLKEMACLDAVSVTKQVHKIRPNWYTKGTRRQQSTVQQTQDDVITGVRSSCWGTLIADVFELRKHYNQEYKPIRDEIEKTKEQIRITFAKNLKSVTANKKNYTKKYKAELYTKRKKDLALADTPYLKYYYEAVKHCSKWKRIDYSHLIRTFTLRSRFEFDCLDTNSRIYNFKTPARKQPTVEASTSTPRRQNIQVSSSRKRKPDQEDTNNRISKPDKKRPLELLPCEKWIDNTAYCRFCNQRLVIPSPRELLDSHLLYECQGIPNSQPLVKTRARHPKGLMARLAAISAVPDPGGDIV